MPVLVRSVVVLGRLERSLSGRLRFADDHSNRATAADNSE
jgi:hypothetical protein